MRHQSINVPNAELQLWSEVWSIEQSRDLLGTLFTTLAWEHRPIKVFGRQIMQPRLTCWYGDEGANYRYSGVTNIALPWTSILLHVRERVCAVTGYSFNSVLCNLYRDGQDSVSWHSDDEPDLQKPPIIASVSVGAVRRVHLQHKMLRDNSGRPLRFSWDLPEGSILLMEGETQMYYRHAIMKQRNVAGCRINLTFRQIITRGTGGA